MFFAPRTRTGAKWLACFAQEATSTTQNKAILNAFMSEMLNARAKPVKKEGISEGFPHILEKCPPPRLWRGQSRPIQASRDCEKHDLPMGKGSVCLAAVA